MEGTTFQTSPAAGVVGVRGGGRGCWSEVGEGGGRGGLVGQGGLGVL